MGRQISVGGPGDARHDRVPHGGIVVDPPGGSVQSPRARTRRSVPSDGSKRPEARYAPRSPARAVVPFQLGLIDFQVAHRQPATSDGGAPAARIHQCKGNAGPLAKLCSNRNVPTPATRWATSRWIVAPRWRKSPCVRSTQQPSWQAPAASLRCTPLARTSKPDPYRAAGAALPSTRAGRRSRRRTSRSPRLPCRRVVHPPVRF